MILNISFTNYRSFKEKVDFSMIAESSKSKENNVFTETIGKNDNIRVLKACAIIGANASGKSSLLRGMFEMISFITKEKSVVGNDINAYDSFVFDEETKKLPVEFSIDFIASDKNKYSYSTSFDNKNIISEKLEYYPKNRSVILFERNIPENKELLKHTGYIGTSSKNKKVDLFHNQLMLSKFGTDIPHEIISEIFIYFKGIDILNVVNVRMLSSADREIRKLSEKDKTFRNKLNHLIRLADTGVNKIVLSKNEEKDFNFPNDFSENLKTKIINDNKYNLITLHDFYKGDKLIRKDEPFPFEEESHGTKSLFALGGKLLQVLEAGQVVFVDEIETSLHPYLTKLLISLFQNSNINKNNAQLIFTTHDTNIIDKKILRKDQVWLAEKNNKGETDLFSLQDFSDVREDTPFDKWYLAGKFGALPNIKSIENLF